MFAALNMQPISLSEGKGFLQFAQTLVNLGTSHGTFDVHHHIAHRTTLTKTHLQNIYTREMDDTLRLMAVCDTIGHNRYMA